MTVIRLLRPAQRILTATVVAAVAATCLVSASTSTTAGRHATSTNEAATQEWQSRTSPVQPVAQHATPALGTKSYERRVLIHINRVRGNHGLSKLRFAPCANRVANHWSAHLSNTGGFYHQSMNRLLRVCNARYAGETLAKGSVRPQTIVRMWMHSAPHRHILMSHHPKRVGVGATPNSRGQWVVAANFMRF